MRPVRHTHSRSPPQMHVRRWEAGTRRPNRRTTRSMHLARICDLRAFCRPRHTGWMKYGASGGARHLYAHTCEPAKLMEKWMANVQFEFIKLNVVASLFRFGAVRTADGCWWIRHKLREKTFVGTLRRIKSLASSLRCNFIAFLAAEQVRSINRWWFSHLARENASEFVGRFSSSKSPSTCDTNLRPPTLDCKQNAM